MIGSFEYDLRLAGLSVFSNLDASDDALRACAPFFKKKIVLPVALKNKRVSIVSADRRYDGPELGCIRSGQKWARGSPAICQEPLLRIAAVGELLIERNGPAC
jgi:hypothetical protein